MSSPILKSLTFVPQPKPSSDPLIMKRERMVSPFGRPEEVARRSPIPATHQALGEERGRREGAGREAPAHQ